jgi:asparagine synthase (glutamine-hydrolysing)
MNARWPSHPRKHVAEKSKGNYSMFLVTLPAVDNIDIFRPLNVYKFPINSTTAVSIITDNFLSRLSLKRQGFSVIESPLTRFSRSENLISIQIDFSRDENTLDLLRTTVSGRSIYYYINTDGKFFCSTHIAMLRKAGVPIVENTDVLAEFFVYRFVSPPFTLYKNIYQLLAGSSLQVKVIDDHCVVSRMNTYTPPKPIHHKLNKDIYRDEILDILQKNMSIFKFVKDRMAILFSGGLDSSILFRVLQYNLEIADTFSTGYPFEDPKMNIEKEYASSAAASLAAKHSYYEGSIKDYLFGMLESIFFAEEPIHHLQSVPLYLLFKNGIPKSKDIIICGEGADSVFGLELHSSIYRIEKLLVGLLSRHAVIHTLELISSITQIKNDKIKFLRELTKRHLPIYDARNLIWSFGAYGSIDWVLENYNKSINEIIEGRYRLIEPVKDRSWYDILSILSVFGSTAISTAIWSKLAESQEKLIYYPFIEERIMNYAYSVAWEVKLKSKKHILREIARRLEIPDFIINRSKSGFGIKPARWATTDGIFELLSPLVRRYFDKQLVQEVQSIETRKAMIFWNMLNYGIWKRLFIENEPLERLVEELDSNIRSSPLAAKLCIR